jgi:UDP-N-acetylglucosamine 2-epimerase (non-hydrolysing)
VAAFLSEVPVAHVEAGLRTYASEPFPEEALRRMIACVAKWHFCPDKYALGNIGREVGGGTMIHQCDVGGIEYYNKDFKGYVVGNTINDTLPKHPFRVLATLHRRENWGKRILDAIEILARFAADDKTEVFITKHPNWRRFMSEAVYSDLGPAPDTLCYYQEPADRETFVKRMRGADLVVTDSGGLQEECAFLGIPCIVFRTATERTALLENGAIELVHPDRPEALRAALDRHLQRRYTYGRGDTSEKIAKILMEELSNEHD